MFEWKVLECGSKHVGATKQLYTIYAKTLEQVRKLDFPDVQTVVEETAHSFHARHVRHQPSRQNDSIQTKFHKRAFLL